MMFPSSTRMIRWCIAMVIIAISIPSVQSILNGKTAIPHSHPWLLNLKTRDLLWPIWGDFRLMCGASLIRAPYLENASDLAITAAHCVDRRGRLWYEIEYIVRASDHDQEETDRGEIIVEVVRALPHPNFYMDLDSNSVQNDIAILKLSRAIEFSATIKPIELAKEGDEIPHDSDCTVAGWGATWIHGRSSTDSSRMLRQIDVQLSSNPRDCASRRNAFYPKTEICSRITDGCSPFHGDSGTPLVCQRANENVLFGITSRIWSQKDSLYPLGCIFVKVASYHAWIQMQTEDLNGFCWNPFCWVSGLRIHLLGIMSKLLVPI